MNRLTPRVAMEVAAHEGLVRQAYKDSVGVWTWSVGITSASGHNVARYIGNPQTLEKCLEVWVWALERYADDVREAFAGHDLTEAQFAAALSFHYNTGAIKRASWVRKWKAGDVVGARKSFMDWRKPASIMDRRRKERDLFFSGTWSSDGKMTEYTRVRPNGTPDWGSAKRVDVRDALEGLLGEKASEPPATAPITHPDPAEQPSPLAAFFAAILSFFRRKS